MDKLMKAFSDLGYVDETNDKIVSFGLKQLCTLLKDILFATAVAFVMGKMSAGIIFEVAYIPVRVYAGGAHASNERLCKYLTYGSIVVCMACIFYLPVKLEILHFILVVSVGTVFITAPVESKNKPLNAKERTVFYQRCIGITILEMISYCLLIYAGNFFYAKVICIALVLVAVGLLVGKRQR